MVTILDRRLQNKYTNWLNLSYLRIIWKSIFIDNNIFCSSHPDPNKWPVQDISPQDGMFNVNDNEQVEFVLSGLLPNKQYFLKSAINVRDDSVDSGYQVGHGIDRYYLLVLTYQG